MRRPAVPQAHLVQQHPREHALHAVRVSRFTQIVVLQIPGIAHRRMYIGEVQLVRAGYDTLRDREATRQHDVVSAEVELLDRYRH